MKPFDESQPAPGRAPAPPLNHARPPLVTFGEVSSPDAETQPGYYVHRWADGLPHPAVEAPPDGQRP